MPGKGEEFLCLVSHHSYTSDNYGSGGTSGDGFAYTGRYVFMPSNSPLMPEKKTPRSDVVGPQTAMVVGEDKEDTSEEIDCDEYGRILVQFGWDLEGDYSMRCRVSQNWSGGGWGGMIIPRIGMEVLVEFLDGDPDKPLVTGCVYNGRNKMAYPLPEHKTKSVFRTDTYKKTGFNEMVFEDEPDKEHITFKAHKDFSKLVLHDAISRVHHNDVENVGANKLFEVGNNFQGGCGRLGEPHRWRHRTQGQGSAERDQRALGQVQIAGERRYHQRRRQWWRRFWQVDEFACEQETRVPLRVGPVRAARAQRRG